MMCGDWIQQQSQVRTQWNGTHTHTFLCAYIHHYIHRCDDTLEWSMQDCNKYFFVITITWVVYATWFEWRGFVQFIKTIVAANCHAIRYLTTGCHSYIAIKSLEAADRRSLWHVCRIWVSMRTQEGPSLTLLLTLHAIENFRIVSHCCCNKDWDNLGWRSSRFKTV